MIQKTQGFCSGVNMATVLDRNRREPNRNGDGVLVMVSSPSLSFLRCYPEFSVFHHRHHVRSKHLYPFSFSLSIPFFLFLYFSFINTRNQHQNHISLLVLYVFSKLLNNAYAGMKRKRNTVTDQKKTIVFVLRFTCHFLNRI